MLQELPQAPPMDFVALGQNFRLAMGGPAPDWPGPCLGAVACPGLCRFPPCMLGHLTSEGAGRARTSETEAFLVLEAELLL